MNADETMQLLGIVRTMWPAQRFDDDPRAAAAAWGMVLGDCTLAETRVAVVRLARTGTTWCQPGDVRREVAADRGALAPNVDEMLDALLNVAADDGVGRLALHPVARRVYDANGGASAIRTMHGPGIGAMRRALADTAQTHDRAVLAIELPPARAQNAIEQQPGTRTIAAAQAIADRYDRQ